MKQVIHIFGASGSGTSTLGKYISDKLGYKFMDSDDYFWLPTDPPFTAKREPSERVRLMKRDIEENENAVISGSIADWGNELMPQFTLAVRLVTDTGVRLERLKRREYARFGARIMPGGDMYDEHQRFIKWASEYDDGGLEMRSRRSHDEWQKMLKCKLLVLSGEDTPESNLGYILSELKEGDKDEKI